MDAVVIIGILLVIFVLMFCLTWIIENGAEWLDDRITEHYVLKAHRERRKARRQRR